MRSIGREKSAAWHAVTSAREHVEQARAALAEARRVLELARRLTRPPGALVTRQPLPRNCNAASKF